MMARTLFPRDLFAELDRLQRGMQQRIDMTPSIRGLGRDGFPAINVGGMPQSVELYAFAPGSIRPASTCRWKRASSPLPASAGRTPSSRTPRPPHIEERFAGRYRRVVRLPDDVDAAAIEARYRNGVLHIRIPRQQAAQPRRIQIQSGDQP